LLNATVGMQRAIARLRPDTTRPAQASRPHRRTVRAARAVQAHLIGPRDARARIDAAAIVRRLTRPQVTAERALPVGIAAMVLLASAASFLPNGTPPPTGGPVGDGDAVRIAIGGGFGVDRSTSDLDGWTDFVPVEDPEPARRYDFRPLTLEQIDTIPDPGDVAVTVDPGSITGPFLSDGTLVAGFAPDTTVQDGSALLRSYRVRSGDTLVGIASRFGISMMSVWWANDLKNKNDLHIGQVLTIPPVSGLVVEVGDTDTLNGLAARYGVESQTILDANGLADPNLIVGQTLVIPGARGEQIATPKPTKRPTVSRPRSSTSNRPRATVRPPTTYHGGQMLWPVVGGGNYISQYFHTGHYGLDIAADAGSKVRAAAGGTVIFAGWKSNGGGYQVWIAHGSGTFTTYNHMSGVSVGRGQHVGRGQQVGRVGCTGFCTGPHLHFEVWKGPVWDGGYRVNPLRYL
jgi:murein DD-endopeptidase MepM/ murein hydrolase activator NlpD